MGHKLLVEIMAAKAGKWYSLALVLVIVICTAGFVLYRIDNQSLLYFGDAASRLVKSREFIDSQHPGLSNIGTVWLPLPQLLLMPFASINALFYSGIAGAVVGIPFLVGTGLLLFGIIRRMTHSRPVASLGACLFALNPNVVYMALTPMSEADLFFFVTLAGYALLRWLETDSVKWLYLCAVGVMLATMCRYEAWVLAPFIVLVSTSKGGRSGKESRRLSAIGIAAIGSIALSGIAFWLIWNAAVYGNALEFLHWSASISPALFSGSLLHGPLARLITYGRAVANIFGPVLLLISIGVFFRFRRKGAEWKHVLLLIFFALPPLFIFYALMTNRIHMDQWQWNWLFVLTLGLLLSVAGAIGLTELFSTVRSTFMRVAVIAGLLVMPIIQMAVPEVGVATFNDAAKSRLDMTRYSTALGERLHFIDEGSSIALLTGYGQAERIMISSGLPLKRFQIICYPDKMDSLEPLSASDRYVVVENDLTPKSQELIDNWVSRGQLRNYEILSENGRYILLEGGETFAIKGRKAAHSKTRSGFR